MSINNKIIKEDIVLTALDGSYSYTEYRALVAQLATEEKSTGPQQTEALANYTQGMSIPKLIQQDDATKELTGDWGPRSKNATKLVTAYKAAHGSLTAEFKQDLQVWYNKDKGQSILTDLLALLPLE